MRARILSTAMMAVVSVPASLLAQPAGESPASEAASVLEIARQAQAKDAAGDWTASVSLWARAVQLNPVQPYYWYALGEARYDAGDYRGAIPAYQRTEELGGPLMGPPSAAYRIARCHARLGDKERAIQALERALALGFRDLGFPAEDPALTPLREDPRFKKLLGRGDVTKLSRDEGWRHDLSVLVGEVHRKGFNPDLWVHRPITREQFDAQARALDEAIPRLTDGQIVLELMKLMVSLRDGHSAVWEAGENPLFRAALPLRMFWFEEGVFVTAADPKYKDLLGAQLLALDGHPTEEVFKALEPYVNRDLGNPITLKLGLPYHVRMLAVLHAAGLVKSPDRVVLKVRDLSGTLREVTVEADAKEPEIWNQLPAPPSWVTLASTMAAPPLYLRHMDKAQWFEYLPEHRTLYFQFNRVLDDPKEPLAKFTERLFRFVDENNVDKLVIDMRWNNGGNTFLGHPLLLGLIGNKKINQRGKLWVIIGRRTYSAAQNMATYFERYTNATFVGEPTGSSPNSVGEESPVTLPYSKLMANVSYLFWESSWPQDRRIWLAPQVYVPPTFADFRAGRDRALEAVLDAAAPSSAPSVEQWLRPLR